MSLTDNKQKRKQTEHSSVLGVMAKFWQPGRVKTRLGSTIGMERSAQLHQLFVGHLLSEMTGDESGKRGWHTQWVSSPSDCLEVSRQQISLWNLEQNEQCVDVVDQGEGDLGDRMYRWFDRQLGADDLAAHEPPKREAIFQKAILIGADCPLICRSDITLALEKLRHSDAVLGPAADGGYYLIGFRAPLNPQTKRVFSEIAWSQDDVFDVTCQRIKEVGMTVSFLPTQEDVDTEVELNRLRTSLAENFPTSAASVKRLSESIDQVLKTEHES
ncbi:TIGR04282 family arsenosugar biosynthesis glycosyltransferase [Rubripirellula obstinata]|nr:TIGR04282 family arsenosugar biosynthesis glycosyltransferase [Rubripirellula obstinata]